MSIKLKILIEEDGRQLSSWDVEGISKADAARILQSESLLMTQMLMGGNAACITSINSGTLFPRIKNATL